MANRTDDTDAEQTRTISTEDLPAREDVNRRAETRNGILSDQSVTVREFAASEDGPVAVLDTPAPWETPTGLKPVNEILKALPYAETKRSWDSEREAWTVLASELTNIAGEIASHGYPVFDDADRPTDENEDEDDSPDARTDGGHSEASAWATDEDVRRAVEAMEREQAREDSQDEAIRA